MSGGFEPGREVEPKEVANRVLQYLAGPEVRQAVTRYREKKQGGAPEVAVKPPAQGEVAPPTTRPRPSEEAPIEPPRGRLGTEWAVVVGISEYRDTRIPRLRYASADAKSVYDWLVSPSGGEYAPSHVRLLLDKDATYEALRETLFEWTQQVQPEDLLLVYFACHGSPAAPDRMDRLFLLPCDVAYGKIASKGFPMWDIEKALKEFVRARKVIVLADACHAGGVGDAFEGTRSLQVVPGHVAQGLQGLSRVNDGVAVLTASGAKQVSREGEQWGGGHGVFTFYLLKGLQGEADYNKDGKVTLGELIPYVSENVRRETEGAQNPEVAGKFDPALTLGR